MQEKSASAKTFTNWHPALKPAILSAACINCIMSKIVVLWHTDALGGKLNWVSQFILETQSATYCLHPTHYVARESQVLLDRGSMFSLAILPLGFGQAKRLHGRHIVQGTTVGGGIP